ncbi:MAG: hypothetical protein DWH82_11585, partial [Planctomycetota bacterium]
MNLTALWLNGLLAMGQPGVPEVLPAVRPMVMPLPPAPVVGSINPASMQVVDGEAAKDFENEAPEEEVLLLRRMLNRTALGEVLNDKGVVVRGFTNGNFTASTAPKNNLPMAMNYAGNQFLLEQNTLIIDKAVDIESDE